MDSTSPIARRIAGKSSVASGSKIIFAMVSFLTTVEKPLMGRNPPTERGYRGSHHHATAGHGH